MPSDSVFYRVEAHDGKDWTFGIRRGNNTGFPVFCKLQNAEVGYLEEITTLKQQAEALCGGTLRIATVPQD